MTFPLIISFHTDDSHYTSEAEFLEESCRIHNLPLEMGVLPNSGSWTGNCAMKGPYIREQLLKHRKPLLWLDADAVVVQRPVLFDDFPAAFGIYNHRMGEFVSNTIYWGYTPETLELVDRWAELCVADPATWDQKHLQAAYHAIPEGRRPSTLWLPFGYAKIYNREYDGPVYILQNQASRRLKKKINQSREVWGDVEL